MKHLDRLITGTICFVMMIIFFLSISKLIELFITHINKPLLLLGIILICYYFGYLAQDED